MSKRSEEAAYNYAKENGTLGYDYNQIYDAAKNGYEQAEKDTIERAVNVLINLPSLVIPSNYIAYFRKKMMDEDNG